MRQVRIYSGTLCSVTDCLAVSACIYSSIRNLSEGDPSLSPDPLSVRAPRSRGRTTGMEIHLSSGRSGNEKITKRSNEQFIKNLELHLKVVCKNVNSPHTKERRITLKGLRFASAAFCFAFRLSIFLSDGCLVENRLNVALTCSKSD